MSTHQVRNAVLPNCDLGLSAINSLLFVTLGTVIQTCRNFRQKLGRFIARRPEMMKTKAGVNLQFVGSNAAVTYQNEHCTLCIFDIHNSDGQLSHIVRFCSEIQSRQHCMRDLLFVCAGHWFWTIIRCLVKHGIYSLKIIASEYVYCITNVVFLWIIITYYIGFGRYYSWVCFRNT